MTRPPRRPIANPPARLRQRALAGGKWRLWWEPESAVRALGFAPVDLDATRLGWSVAEATRLNQAVAQARAGAPAPQPIARRRTVAQAVEAYRASPAWGQLAPATQTDYLGAQRLILRRWADTPLADIDRAAVHDWYEQLHRTSGTAQASALVRKFSTVLSYADLKGWLPQGNPCARLRLVTPDPRPRVATWAEIDALIAAAPPVMAAAIALAVYLGQRQGDILDARTADLDATRWRLVRSKNGTAGELAMPPAAWGYVAPVWGQHPTHVLPGPNGAPWRPDTFRAAWERVRARAAQTVPSVATLMFRDLRRTFGTLARAGGATPRDVGDALGNTAGFDPRLSQTYMPASADGAARAILSITRKDAADV